MQNLTLRKRQHGLSQMLLLEDLMTRSGSWRGKVALSHSCDLLICPDPRIVTVCLEGLENILKVGEADREAGMNGGVNLYAQMIDECEGLDKIENLQTHDNNEIYEKVVKILEKYWAEEEEQNLPDDVDGNQQGFQFGNNQPDVPVVASNLDKVHGRFINFLFPASPLVERNADDIRFSFPQEAEEFLVWHIGFY